MDKGRNSKDIFLHFLLRQVREFKILLNKINQPIRSKSRSLTLTTLIPYHSISIDCAYFYVTATHQMNEWTKKLVLHPLMLVILPNCHEISLVLKQRNQPQICVATGFRSLGHTSHARSYLFVLIQFLWGWRGV